jgi:predicted RNA-binding protein YlxR (DUF448 family)
VVKGDVKKKHVPHRTCVVCRKVAGKRSLIRLARTTEGIVVDRTGKAAGRGAYLCDDPVCWQQASENNMLNQALRTVLTQEDREMIAEFGTSLVPLNENNP